MALKELTIQTPFPYYPYIAKAEKHVFWIKSIWTPILPTLLSPLPSVTQKDRMLLFEYSEYPSKVSSPAF